jgi:hypothetical protein
MPAARGPPGAAAVGTPVGMPVGLLTRLMHLLVGSYPRSVGLQHRDEAERARACSVLLELEVISFRSKFQIDTVPCSSRSLGTSESNLGRSRYLGGSQHTWQSYLASIISPGAQVCTQAHCRVRVPTGRGGSTLDCSSSTYQTRTDLLDLPCSAGAQWADLGSRLWSRQRHPSYAPRSGWAPLRSTWTSGWAII